MDSPKQDLRTRDQNEVRSETATLEYSPSWTWKDAQAIHGRTVNEQFKWLTETLKDIEKKERK